MLKSLAALAFYARFAVPFSTLGHRRRLAARPAPPFDFRGQRWWVTGATGGIGRAIALGALSAGAEVHALARDPAKLAALRHDAGDAAGRLSAVRVDLSGLAAVEALAVGAGRIDVLVHNVGVMLHDFRRTAEGVEAGFATNLLAPFAMTEALLAAGALEADSLLLSVSSGGAYGAKLDLAALEAADAAAHDGFMAYAQHKRAQIELTRWWNARPGGPRALVMHPGWVDTDGVRASLPGFRRTMRAVLRTPAQGADTALWLAATRPGVDPDGGLWLDRHRDPEHAFALTRGGASAEALAAHLRQRLARAYGPSSSTR
jgi:NAD(P)-dependent dehydrogenase (short-subunit alcohol dehydrogenase family)